MLRKGSGYFDGWYGLPVGHVEADELPIKGLIREMHEELGMTIDPEHAHLVHTMYRRKDDHSPNRADLFFVVDEWTGEPTICEPHKCDGLEWCTIDTLPQKTIPYVADALHAIRAKQNYSEREPEEEMISRAIRDMLTVKA
jgi:8-oxo-dGTP diphosphatase